MPSDSPQPPGFDDAAPPTPTHPDWVAFYEAERSAHREPNCFYRALRYCLNCWHMEEILVVKGDRAAQAIIATGRTCSRCEFPLENL